MSAIYPATEGNIRGFTPDGRAILQKKNHTMPIHFAALVEVGEKKGNKQAERAKAKVEGYRADMVETTEATIGASPADDLSSTFSYEHPRALWRQQERGQWNKFMRMRYRLSTEYIPAEREELRAKMLKTFNTTNPDQFRQMLDANLMNNARLDVKTRRGLVKTTVIDQAVFARRAGSEGGKS